MELKVKVNMPEDTEIFSKKIAESLSCIFMNKLQPDEIDKLIEQLGREDFKLKL